MLNSKQCSAWIHFMSLVWINPWFDLVTYSMGSMRFNHSTSPFVRAPPGNSKRHRHQHPIRHLSDVTASTGPETGDVLLPGTTVPKQRFLHVSGPCDMFLNRTSVGELGLFRTMQWFQHSPITWQKFGSVTWPWVDYIDLQVSAGRLHQGSPVVQPLEHPLENGKRVSLSPALGIVPYMCLSCEVHIQALWMFM